MFFAICRDETRENSRGEHLCWAKIVSQKRRDKNCKTQRLNGEKSLGDLLKNAEVLGANRWVIFSKIVG
jgi:hypothetical protein